MANESEPHFTLGTTGPQQLHLTFDGGRLGADAGLLPVRALEKPLRVSADLTERLPDPRAPQFIAHFAAALLTQAVYQILAGYPDCNDAQQLRRDPLFPILADVTPDADNSLASPSTLSRFPYACTRRQAERPLEDRPVWQEIRAAQTGRLQIFNGYLVDLFRRTRPAPPAAIILAVDASADPVPGHQTLSGYHGYYQQQP